MGLIWLTTRRDLVWRRRRLAMAVAGTTIAFALTLVLTGVREGIDLEAERTVRSLSADAFVVSENVSGPFTSLAQVPTTRVRDLSSVPGVEEAAALVSIRHRIDTDPATDTYLIGAEPGKVGMPHVSVGRPPEETGEAAIGSTAGRDVGDQVDVGGRSFEIVGIVPNVSVWVNIPVLYLTLPDAQALVFDGAPVATALLTRGIPERLPEGLVSLDPSAAVTDLKQPLANAVSAISLIQGLLWIMAAAIVGSMLYISALDRSGDFAVLKAFGTRNSDLVGVLVTEAIAIAGVSAVGAIALSRPLGALYPAVVSFPAWTVGALTALAVGVGVVGALAGARRAIAIDPVEAFATI